MTTTSVPRPAAVAAVLAQASTWTHATRKSDGREFWIIQGNRPGAVYYADAAACTCPDARSRARVCKHSLAVTQFQSRQRPPFAHLAQLTGGCEVTGCPNDREPHERFCLKHVTVDAF
jgi:hypothetical protein